MPKRSKPVSIDGDNHDHDTICMPIAYCLALFSISFGKAGRPSKLAALYPKGHECRLSHETIYNCIYAQPVGELKRDLIAYLRQAKNKQLPRSKGQDRHGQIPDMLSIHLRPPEIEDRQFPGHWEGDLIKGAGNASAVGTLVERYDQKSRLRKIGDDPMVK